MADNVTVDNGGLTDYTVSSDEAVSGQVQRVKLALSADGSDTHIGADANGLDVDVTRVSGTVTVDGSGVTQPVSLSEPISVDDNGGSLTVDGSVTADTELTTADLDTGAGTDTRAVVGLVGSKSGGGQLIPGDATAGLKVDLGADNDVVISDGGNVISVDDAAGSLTVDNAALSVVGGGAEATALRVTVANDSTGVVSVDDNGGSLTVDVGTALPTGDNNIGNVDVVTMPTTTVQGGAAHASPVSGNPNLMAGRASNAIPTDVGADGDAASMWTNRHGAQVITCAPHVGLNGDPWSLVHEAAQYTTQQTSAVLVAGGASEKIVVTKVQIQVGGTTAGTLQLYFGTGAFSRGTSRAIFDGEFAPSATLKPGVILDGPFIAGTNGDDLMVTDSAAINPLTINVWYYVVT